MMNAPMAVPASEGDVSEWTVEAVAFSKDLADDWLAFEQTALCTVFQRWGWISLWYQLIAPHRGLTSCIVLVRGKSGSLRMIVPLAVGMRHGLRTISFADAGACDYNAPLIARDARLDGDGIRRLWRRIKAHLPPADVIVLEKMPERIGGLPNPMLSLGPVQRSIVNAFGVAIKGGPGDWQEQTLTPKFHKDMVAKTRKMGKAAPVRFIAASDGPDADCVYQALVDQRRERFEAMDRYDVLSDEVMARFYRTVTSSAGGGVGILFGLQAAEEIAATGLALLDGDAVHMIMVSHKSERWRNYSPGMQLFLNAMAWGLQSGRRFFDFTTGGESYKVNFGCEESHLFERHEGLSARGRAIAVRNTTLRMAKNIAISMGIRDFVQSVKARRKAGAKP